MADSPAEKRARAKAGSVAERAVDAAVSSVPGGKAAAGVLSGKMSAQDAATAALQDALTAKARDAVPGMGVFNLAKSLYDTGDKLAAGKKIPDNIKQDLMANALASATGMPPGLAKVAMKEFADNPNIQKGDFEKDLAGAAKKVADVGQKTWDGASKWLTNTGLTSAFSDGANAVTNVAGKVGGFLSGLAKDLPKGDAPAQKPGGDFAP